MPPSGAPELIGQTLAGRYVVERQLGKGGMGAVYLARDLNLNEKLVAIKIPRPDLWDEPSIKARWDDEIGKLIDIEPHPHIVKVQDRGRHNGIPYIVMEYQPGGDLKGKLDAGGGRMVAEEVLKWLVDASAALDHLHTLRPKGIIHRDVKPGNFVFDRGGRVFVTDFGIAKALEGPALTRTGVLPGTTLYMAPEAVQGRWEPAYDQYALATTVYECLAGRFPFMADDPYALLTMKATQKPKPLSEVVSDLPEGLSACVMKALEREPEKRFKTCAEFAEEFRRSVKGDTSVPTWLRWVAMGSGAIAIVLALLIGIRGFPPPTVTINSIPPASVSFNGQEERKTPFDVKRVSRGQSYQVRISRPGYVTREETVTPSKWRPGGVSLAYALKPLCADAPPKGIDEALLVRFDDVDLDTEKAILKDARFVTAVGPRCTSDASVFGRAGLSVKDAAGTALAPSMTTDSTERTRTIVSELTALLVRKTLDRAAGGDDSVAVRVSSSKGGLGGAEPVPVSTVHLKEISYVYLRSTEARYILAFTLDASGSIGLLYPSNLDAVESKASSSWFTAGGELFPTDSPGQCAFYVWSSSRPWAPFLESVKAGEVAMAPGAPPAWSAATIPTATSFASKLIGSLPPEGQWSKNKQIVTVE